MSSDSPLQISRLLLTGMGTRIYVSHEDRIPQEAAVLVVSNHRSFMDAPLLMASVRRSIRFACHHYMSQVPVMREIVKLLGCFPLKHQNVGSNVSSKRQLSCCTLGKWLECFQRERNQW